jgi:FHA domain/von Willebrand factor type A domain
LNRLLSSLFLIQIIFSGSAFAWNTLTTDFDIYCQQDSKKLDCKYRELNNTRISTINATALKTKLVVENESIYPESGDITAVLFLVDTSDPARQNVIEKNKTQIKEILSTLKPHHKAGLASFDKSLKIQSPIGTSSFLLSKSIDSLKASGKTTELYRNLLKAMEHLNAFEAERKVIILLSDGQAEDKAYFHSDIIKMARKYGIAINSVGYPRSVSLSVALQTLRRLSEETGGQYIETDTSYTLPKNELNKLLSNIDSGGSFSVNLEDLFQLNEATNHIALSITTQTGVKNFQVPVEIKIKNNIVTQQIASTPIGSNTKETFIPNKTKDNVPVQIITKQAAPQPINLWIWYGLPAAFIIIIVFILITLFLLWKKPEQKSNTPGNEYRPYAYLIANDESGTRYPITRTICRIGRSKDNELNLDDTSISRRHAEIHRNSDGSFEIVDMNSMNGVYINNEKVGKAELHEGDVLEIGDYFLHFTQLSADYSTDESTVMQKTRTPSTH